jgi:hypothetical protein
MLVDFTLHGRQDLLHEAYKRLLAVTFNAQSFIAMAEQVRRPYARARMHYCCLQLRSCILLITTPSTASVCVGARVFFYCQLLQCHALAALSL